VAANLRYRRSLGSRWFVAADLGAGVSLNRTTFPDKDIQAVTTLKPLLASSLSAGQPLGRRLELSAGAGFLLLFFDGTPLTAISPGVRLEYALSKPNATTVRVP